MNSDTSWKSVTKLKAKIGKFSDTLRDVVESTATGNVKNFVRALRKEELPDIPGKKEAEEQVRRCRFTSD